MITWFTSVSLSVPVAMIQPVRLIFFVSSFLMRIHSEPVSVPVGLGQSSVKWISCRGYFPIRTVNGFNDRSMPSKTVSEP